MAKETTPPGKTRTREHMIADLAVNYVERRVLLCGHTAQRLQHDYGYDLTVSTYDERGQVEGGMIFVQVKATDDLPLLKDGRTISWPVSRRDLKLWLHEHYPVILAVYDGQKDRAYWLDVQAYMVARRSPDVFTAGTINFHIPVANRINNKSLETIAQHKRRVHQELQQRRRQYE